MSENRLIDYLDHIRQAAHEQGRVSRYFDVNLDVVWETVQQALLELLPHLAAARDDAEGVG